VPFSPQDKDNRTTDMPRLSDAIDSTTEPYSLRPGHYRGSLIECKNDGATCDDYGANDPPEGRSRCRQFPAVPFCGEKDSSPRTVPPSDIPPYSARSQAAQ